MFKLIGSLKLLLRASTPFAPRSGVVTVSWCSLLRSNQNYPPRPILAFRLILLPLLAP